MKICSFILSFPPTIVSHYLLLYTTLIVNLLRNVYYIHSAHAIMHMTQDTQVLCIIKYEYDKGTTNLNIRGLHITLLLEH